MLCAAKTAALQSLQVHRLWCPLKLEATHFQPTNESVVLRSVACWNIRLPSIFCIFRVCACAISILVCAPWFYANWRKTWWRLVPTNHARVSHSVRLFVLLCLCKTDEATWPFLTVPNCAVCQLGSDFTWQYPFSVQLNDVRHNGAVYMLQLRTKLHQICAYVCNPSKL